MRRTLLATRGSDNPSSDYSDECVPSQYGALPLLPQAHQTTVRGSSKITLMGVSSLPRWVPSQYG